MSLPFKIENLDGTCSRTRTVKVGNFLTGKIIPLSMQLLFTRRNAKRMGEMTCARAHLACCCVSMCAMIVHAQAWRTHTCLRRVLVGRTITFGGYDPSSYDHHVIGTTHYMIELVRRWPAWHAIVLHGIAFIRPTGTMRYACPCVVNTDISPHLLHTPTYVVSEHALL